jgi:16S rRNA (guanine1516-N2)-methyltransferase
VDDPADADAALLLAVTAEGLELREGASPTKTALRIDFTSIDTRVGAGNLSRRQPLARAVGRKNRTVLDATAGLGHDAALLACMGYDVTAVERSPIVAALLADALDRARDDDRMCGALGDRLSIITGEARIVLAELDEPPDVVYIDPMFPPRRKSSALPKKSIRLIRRLVGDDPDADELLDAARGRARNRVVVKRPSYADPVGGAPDVTIKSKLVRYDLYLTGARRFRI